MSVYVTVWTKDDLHIQSRAEQRKLMLFSARWGEKRKNSVFFIRFWISEIITRRTMVIMDDGLGGTE
jgi:hypothetical protein